MANNRSEGRDTFIYDAKHPEEVIGGLILTAGMTNANFHTMVEIVCIFSQNYSIHDEGNLVIENDDNPLQPGNYYLVTNGSITISDEVWLVRTISLSTGTRTASFREAVRERDQGCPISGYQKKGDRGRWNGYEAAHVFPLAYEGHWRQHDYGHWITIPPQNAADGSINSVQNGILMLSHIHQLFDSYLVSINPDDGYKVVCFSDDGFDIAGKRLSQKFIDDPRRPVDQLLRWHLRQSVLANMKEAGEPVFEHDFPSGSDIMGEIRSGPRAGEVMEFELFGRLASSSEV